MQPSMDSQADTKLQEIFRAVFNLAPSADVTAIRQVSEARWDSLAHVSLVAALESEFQLRIDIAEALRLTSYKAAELLLREKGI